MPPVFSAYILLIPALFEVLIPNMMFILAGNNLTYPNLKSCQTSRKLVPKW